MITLIRGISGSGKSFLANKITNGGTICPAIEADDFFLVGETFPVYDFDRSLLEKAHQWCRLETERCLRRYGAVCVANTFTQKWEWQPYLDMAVRYQIELCILEPDTPWKFNLDELVKRNMHNVPRAIIAKQLERWTILDEKEKYYDFRSKEKI